MASGLHGRGHMQMVQPRQAGPTASPQTWDFSGAPCSIYVLEIDASMRVNMVGTRTQNEDWSGLD